MKLNQINPAQNELNKCSSSSYVFLKYFTKFHATCRSRRYCWVMHEWVNEKAPVKNHDYRTSLVFVLMVLQIKTLSVVGLFTYRQIAQINILIEMYLEFKSWQS